MMHNLVKGSLCALLCFAAACDGSSLTSPAASTGAARMSQGSGGSGTSSPTLLSPAPGSPTVSTGVVSFYAVQGQDRSGEVSYLDPSGGNGTSKLLRLRIRPRTQITRPDGTPLAIGDSIRITIQVVDPTTLVAQFEPSGLRFSGKDPANLTMWFRETDHDLNHDGVVNALDAAITQTFSIFRQASFGAPWVRIQSTVNAGADEVTAAIPGFSNYVIAY